MSLDDVYLAFAGTPGHMGCPGRVQPQTRMVEPLGHVGHVGHHEMQDGRRDAGRDLGPELMAQVRARLMPLGRQARAELVAVIDDVFEVAPDLTSARRQVRRLLASHKTLEAAKAVWPAYPDPAAPVANVEPLAPWLAHIARHCALVPDDRRYLMQHLSGQSAAEAMRLAHRYGEVWTDTARAEPAPHRQANAGRRAANRWIREGRA
ncbi:hypothetical protein SAMN05421509_10171 [Chromohalobacter canadensis]|uniref:Uncharacterized protein n=1 Tax=Chromohalobacter canadensis TaxID=141389 RepID=A0A285VA63_9GAMM|nr:hypothetical protein [Chromohalobacter canadensis]SOC51012.1 hypothetical protein SAMN05421509_10171 [Chromohalobacter canadensis]